MTVVPEVQSFWPWLTNHCICKYKWQNCNIKMKWQHMEQISDFMYFYLCRTFFHFCHVLQSFWNQRKACEKFLLKIPSPFQPPEPLLIWAHKRLQHGRPPLCMGLIRFIKGSSLAGWLPACGPVWRLLLLLLCRRRNGRFWRLCREKGRGNNCTLCGTPNPWLAEYFIHLLWKHKDILKPSKIMMHLLDTL